jgi:hypothetical protein
VLFKASGIDEEHLVPVPWNSRSSAYWDKQEAWKGTAPEDPESSIRIEAASYEGKPVSWRLIMPNWDGPSVSDQQFEVIPASYVLLIFLLVVGAALLARRNLRMGRGDKRGATRLACLFIILNAAEWIFGEHHVWTADPSQFSISACFWLADAVWIWLI